MLHPNRAKRARLEGYGQNNDGAAAAVQNIIRPRGSISGLAGRPEPAAAASVLPDDGETAPPPRAKKLLPRRKTLPKTTLRKRGSVALLSPEPSRPALGGNRLAPVPKKFSAFRPGRSGLPVSLRPRSPIAVRPPVMEDGPAPPAAPPPRHLLQQSAGLPPDEHPVEDQQPQKEEEDETEMDARIKELLKPGRGDEDSDEEVDAEAIFSRLQGREEQQQPPNEAAQLDEADKEDEETACF